MRLRAAEEGRARAAKVAAGRRDPLFGLCLVSYPMGRSLMICTSEQSEGPKLWRKFVGASLRRSTAAGTEEEKKIANVAFIGFFICRTLGTSKPGFNVVSEKS